jgi:hypothetical protein
MTKSESSDARKVAEFLTNGGGKLTVRQVASFGFMLPIDVVIELVGYGASDLRRI